MKQRLDQTLVAQHHVATRSQAESWIKLGKVSVDGHIITKPGTFVDDTVRLRVLSNERYVSRAGLKLASIADALHIDFKDKIILDVGSSTGGFTDYALQHGAKRVYAVDVGTDQLHASLRGNVKVELHEKTDVRDFTPAESPDIVVIDVSFVSLRTILPHISTLVTNQTQVIAMAKPQFEATRQELGSNGVVKNDSVRRTILKAFEQWVKESWLIIGKADSEVTGATGNKERFYSLTIM